MIDPLVLVILGIVVIAVATSIGPRLNIAGPLLLMLLGLGVSLLPFVDVPEIDPEIILVGVLPPLLYSAAVSLPAIEFRRDFRPIAGLSVVLVLLTAVALAFFFMAVIPSLPFLLALALGAILSPTDAVATSIVKRLGISRRVTTLLEGESLLNDATSLIILRVAVAGVAAGGGFSPGTFVGAFVWGAVIAVVIGALTGYLALRLRALVRHSAANTAIGFVVPFAAYLPTEELGGSGLVASVVAGIVVGQGAARRFTPEQRLSDELNWRTVELVLEGAVFLLMGLELKSILDANLGSDHGIWHGLWLAAAALGIVLVVRGAWVSMLVWIQSRRARTKERERLEVFEARIDEFAQSSPEDRRGSPALHEKRVSGARRRLARAFADLDYYQASPLGWKHGSIIAWAGMRGVVTLAAAQTLPRETTERPLLIFVAFLVAVGSLALQGFTLPWVVRALRLDGGDEDIVDQADQKRIDEELRVAAASALHRGGLTRLDGSEFPAEFVERVGSRLTTPPDEETTARARDVLEVRLLLIEAMRTRLVEISSDGTYSTAALRHALAELDADELSLRLRLDAE
ncbi:sodium:proton antiporter [Microbacterium sp. SLBN-146]|uniref:cation:proton antiporter n=1 Tax=Microbacterium sp. SLBN-146 TaxID=2768457 RepID=UPI001153094C|nr:sodium:proton antiporter [Microbacterium sp. SLBN-146]TQJ30572.1 sodium/proton antiporter (CPA1 family) [Microbacterium sp. SLBN-146]